MEDTVVDLFFSPLACSLACRIASYEADIHLNFIEVDPVTKQLPDGRNYLQIFPLGLLPALRLDDGYFLSKDATILQHLAASANTSTFGPVSSLDLDRLHQWLAIVGSDLHEAISLPLVADKTGGGIGSHTRDFVIASLDFLDERLRERQFLLGGFSSADAYLYSLLQRTPPTRIDLSAWPAIKTYCDRLAKRSSVSRAVAEELALLEAAVARHPSISELSFSGLP
jgi:glutathione S-transferase